MKGNQTYGYSLLAATFFQLDHVQGFCLHGMNVEKLPEKRIIVNCDIQFYLFFWNYFVDSPREYSYRLKIDVTCGRDDIRHYHQHALS